MPAALNKEDCSCTKYYFLMSQWTITYVKNLFLISELESNTILHIKTKWFSLF